MFIRRRTIFCITFTIKKIIITGNSKIRSNTSPPRNPKTDSGDRYINIIWLAPKDNGGSEIIGFNIYRGLNSGEEIYLDFVSGNIKYYQDTTVKNGETYYYCLTSLNIIGESKFSDEVNAIPLGFPSPPRNLDAIAGDEYIYLSWQKPIDDDGTDITEFKIYRGNMEGIETYFNSVDGVTINFNDTSVKNGQIHYYYRMNDQRYLNCLTGLDLQTIQLFADLLLFFL